MFSRTALSLRCVCVWAGRRCAFDACFFAVFHGSGGAVDENVFSRHVFSQFLHIKSDKIFPYVLHCVAAILQGILRDFARRPDV